ncbi:MAG TPA: ACT domain-containing protein [Lysobacter sp.]
MSGETDLAMMLRTLDVEPREGTWVLLTRPAPDATLDAQAAARIDEREGITYVVPEHVAHQHGGSPGFVAAWLSLRVHSSLDAVCLTAAVSCALADAGIACNVLAGFHHDHLLVPAARRDDAITALHALRGN